MIDTSLIQIIQEIYGALFDTQEVIEKEKLKKNEETKQPKGFIEKPAIKKSILAIGLSYVMGSILALSHQFAMSLANPHQFATLAMLCPPVLNTVVYALGTVYQFSKIIGLLVKKNPHKKNSPEAIRWSNNRRINVISKAITMGACVILLAASLSPILGTSNALGALFLSGLIAMDVAAFIIKKINAYAKIKMRPTAIESRKIHVEPIKTQNNLENSDYLDNPLKKKSKTSDVTGQFKSASRKIIPATSSDTFTEKVNLDLKQKPSSQNLEKTVQRYDSYKGHSLNKAGYDSKDVHLRRERVKAAGLAAGAADRLKCAIVEKNRELKL